MKTSIPRPFLKWVGGKRQLLPKLQHAVEVAGPFRRYHEPFLGGGALFFALARAGVLKSGASLSDINPNLVEAYRAVRDDIEGVVRALRIHARRHCEDYYYEMRRRKPRSVSARAARIIYLNKTCFNGLYRVNSKGNFNVPFGRYKNPSICDEANLRSVAVALKGVDIEERDFPESMKLVREGDLVYCDPPYDPVSKTADFTAYSKGGFDVTHQEALAKAFAILAEKNAHVILSNSKTPLTQELYEGFNITTVSAIRIVNSRADRRGAVPEVIVTTFPLAGGKSTRERRLRVPARIGGGERILAKQWLIQNDYQDVATLIDEVVEEWNRDGKRTRRNWWDVLAGNARGKPRIISGRKFPVLRAAQLRQGVPVSESAICQRAVEGPPPKKSVRAIKD